MSKYKFVWYLIMFWNERLEKLQLITCLHVFNLNHIQIKTLFKQKWSLILYMYSFCLHPQGTRHVFCFICVTNFNTPDLWGRIIIRRDVLWYGVGVCPSVCLSVRLSVGLSTKLVNTIQTELFQLGPSNLVHILQNVLMTRGRTLLIFKVMG